MITLVFFAFVGAMLFFSLLLVAQKNWPTATNEAAALIAVGEILKLESLSLRVSKQILDSTDYQILRSNPALAEVAKRFRRERRDLALLWFSMLLDDLKKLRRFRGFLIRGGLPTQFYEEVQVAYCLCTSVIFLNFLRALVCTCGPFALHTVIRHATAPIEGMSRASAMLLNRLPSSQWREIANQWVTSVS